MIGLHGLGIDLVIIFAVHFYIGDSSCSDVVECVSPFKSARMSIDYGFYIYIENISSFALKGLTAVLVKAGNSFV